MKNLFVIICLTVFSFAATAQDVNPVKNAFSSANAASLSAILSDEVELCIGDDVEFLSKNETVTHLNRWFSANTPNGIRGTIDGSGAVKFYDGTCTTDKGNYRVIVYYKQQGSGYIVDEIRITPAK